MRLVFVGKSHAFSLPVLRALMEGNEVVGFVESAARPGRGGSRAARVRRALAGRSALEDAARRAGGTYLRLERGVWLPLERLLETSGAELICIASLSQLLPVSVLARPRHGAINLHPSLLPKYPGPFPILWQYLEFETTFGVTVHRVDAAEDSGDVLEQEPFAVSTGSPLDEVLARATDIGARLMAKAVADIASGASSPHAQVGARGPRARAVGPDEPLIDWSGWPLERVHHALRGTQPWLESLRHPRYRTLDWDIGEAERGDGDGNPGAVLRDGAGYYAAHREGKIRLSLKSGWRTRARRALVGR